MEVYRFKPQDLAILQTPNGGIVAKINRKHSISLQSLNTVTNTVNDVYKNTHTINNDTNKITNTKDVENKFNNIQNGFRIVGNDYKFENHMNKGYEEFGLMLMLI